MASLVQQCWGLPIYPIQRESCKLPRKPGSVDVTVTDMPSGRRMGFKRRNWHLFWTCPWAVSTDWGQAELYCSGQELLCHWRHLGGRKRCSTQTFPERDMNGRRCLVSGGRRGSSSCCGLASEICPSNFCSSFRTRWRKTSLVMRRMKMTKHIYASSVHSSHDMKTT